MSLRQFPALYLADTLSACPRPSGRGLPPDAPAAARQLGYGKVALFLLIVSVADWRQRPPPEQPSVTRRRFDEAIVAGKKALRQNPSDRGPYPCLASACAPLARDAEARETAARVLETDPAFTISA